MGQKMLSFFSLCYAWTRNKNCLPGTLSHKSLNVKGLKYWGLFFSNWLTERASLVYSHTFITLKFCASNECLPCLSLFLILTVSVLYGGNGEGRGAWEIMGMRSWQCVWRLLYVVGCDVSQERKTGLGRGRGDSVAGEETRRERRSKQVKDAHIA